MTVASEPTTPPTDVKPSVFRLWCQARETFGFGTDAYDYDEASKEFDRLMVEHGYENESGRELTW